jgi:ABC-type uncharacterized transport system auxiliary subunit
MTGDARRAYSSANSRSPFQWMVSLFHQGVGATGVRRPSSVALLAAMTLSIGGCGYLMRTEPLTEPVDLIAVLPVVREEAPKSANPIPEETAERGERLAPDAERVVTAQIYSVLANSPRWRFVPDLTVQDALRKTNSTASISDRVVQVGKAVKADAVLTGAVSRFTQRDGSEYGARNPSSVALRLMLISTKSGQVLWKGDFDKTQEPLTSNLFDWWMFWRAGPRWMTAEELSRLGIEELLRELDHRLPE